MGVFVLLLVIGTTIWVGIDASNLGVQRGRLGGGGLDMSVASWVICCLLLWIVAFPCYLVARERYQRLPRAGYGTAPQWAAPAPVAWSPPAAWAPAFVQTAYAAPAAAPPQYSADGRWWWNGQQWVPAPPRV